MGFFYYWQKKGVMLQRGGKGLQLTPLQKEECQAAQLSVSTTVYQLI